MMEYEGPQSSKLFSSEISQVSVEILATFQKTFTSLIG